MSLVPHSPEALAVDAQVDRCALSSASRAALSGFIGTVVWPGGVDLDPDVLRGDREPASRKPIPRRVIQTA